MLLLVSKTYDEDGMLEEEIEFKLGDYDTLDELLSHLKKMKESRNVNEISSEAYKSMSCIQRWCLECFGVQMDRDSHELMQDTSDARVRAQGGE